MVITELLHCWLNYTASQQTNTLTNQGTPGHNTGFRKACRNTLQGDINANALRIKCTLEGDKGPSYAEHGPAPHELWPVTTENIEELLTTHRPFGVKLVFI